jgi:hypothetical protein
MPVLAFTDEQIAELRFAALPIPYRQRQVFLERVVQLLSGRPIGNGDVQRAAQRAQIELIGIQVPEE